MAAPRRIRLPRGTPLVDGVASTGRVFVISWTGDDGTESWQTVDPDTGRLGAAKAAPPGSDLPATTVVSGIAWDTTDTTVTVHTRSPTDGTARSPR